jgi:hypothetical protein
MVRVNAEPSEAIESQKRRFLLRRFWSVLLATLDSID